MANGVNACNVRPADDYITARLASSTSVDDRHAAAAAPGSLMAQRVRRRRNALPSGVMALATAEIAT